MPAPDLGRNAWWVISGQPDGPATGVITGEQLVKNHPQRQQRVTDAPLSDDDPSSSITFAPDERPWSEPDARSEAEEPSRLMTL